MKKFVGPLVKIGISVALLGYLGWKASRDTNLPKLVAGEKDWVMLAFALLAVLAAVLITIVRWHLLLRTLGLQFTLRESLRAGFMGYLFNLLPLGLAGADAVKAGFLIHRNPSRKTEAIAMVIIDRVLGLYALLVLAGGAALLLDFEALSFKSVEDKERTILLCRIAQYVGIAATIIFGLMLIPGATNLPLWDRLEHVAGVGPILKRLVTAMRTFRQASGRLLLAVIMSFAVHTFYVAMVFLVGRGLSPNPESPMPLMGSHFVFTPISMIAGALPIGTLEATLNGLYYVFSPPGVPDSQGLLIALTYRLLQISVATIGVFYYLAGRQEVKQLMDENKQAEATA